MPRYRWLTRRHVLWLGLGTLAALSSGVASKALHHNSKIQALYDPQRDFSVVGDAPLKERATAKGLFYGAATDYDALFSSSALAASFARECDVIVPGLELKWSGCRPSVDRFDFTRSDRFAEFARSHGMQLRGHTLVWHEPGALPPWFKETINSQNAKQLMVEHISRVVEYYAGQMHSWDVVNEAINIWDKRSDGWRKTPWLEFVGKDYIDLAFRAAAEADPKAMLVYNDFGLDYDTEADEAKRVAVLNLLKDLKHRGTPIHAFGMQAHLKGEQTNFNPSKLKAFLREVAELGLKIIISEIDVADNKLPADIAVRDRIVAAAYEDYLDAALSEPAVIGVISWGLNDGNSWLSMFRPRSDGLPVRPLPLDEQLNRKLAWNAIARAFDKAPKRNAGGIP